MTVSFHTQITHRHPETWDRQLELARKGLIPGMTLVMGIDNLDIATTVVDAFVASKRPFWLVGRITNTGLEDKYKDLYAKSSIIHATALGKQWATEFISFIRTRSLDEQTTAKWFYWQPFDEVKANDGTAEHDYKWHSAFDRAAMDEMIANGFRYAAVNLYWGNPNHPPYQSVDEWDYLWETIKQVNFYGPDKAIIQLHAYIDGCSINHPQDYALDRVYHLIARLRKSKLTKTKIALGETGLTVEWFRCGQAGYTHKQYGLDLIKADLEHWLPYPEILFAGIYTLDKNDGGGDFPADGEIFDLIYNYLIGRGVPPAPVPSPVPVPEPETPPQKERIVRVNVNYPSTKRLNVRTGPGINFPVVHELAHNQRVFIDYVTSNQWAHLSDKIDGKDVFSFYPLLRELK